ncbi:MAG: class B sortase [Mogibacterium sp.]|nr:class B sortase [Mogibacterium sp.]
MIIVDLLTKVLRRVEIILLIVALAFAGSTLYDMYALTSAGVQKDGFPGFDELKARNRDTVGWIRMDGTHINHPVVQGEDNYEYINKGIDGEFYQGGSIFLDAGCSPDMTDKYLIIHGHHMSRGAMFSDLTCYLNEEFFEKNKLGDLITPDYQYELTVCGAGIVDAYDGEVYYTDPERDLPLELLDRCSLSRELEFKEGDKLVMLSTCSGDMTNDRSVVFCRARRTGDSDGIQN